MKRTTAIGLAIWSSGLTISPVDAQALPNASTAAGYQYYRSDWNGNSLYENRYGDGATALASMNLSDPLVGVPYVTSIATPGPVVSATSHLIGAVDWHAIGYSQISYSVSVLGSGQDVVIPIHYIARLRAEINGLNAVADANLSVNSGVSGTQQYRSAKCSTSCVGYNPDLDVSGVISTRGASPLSVTLSASTEVGYGGGLADAFVDPFFYIDPTYLSANPGLTLQFSPFVGNDAPTLAVPEPATWAMMITGFGLVGRLARRRRGNRLARA